MRTLNLTSVGDGPDYRRDPKTKHYCHFCQKDMVPEKPYREVFAFYFDGAPCVVNLEDAVKAPPPGGGWLPVGNDCAKVIGLEWSRPHAPEAA